MTRMKLAVSKDENGHGLLHKAVFHGHRDIVEWLIEKYPETLDMRDWVSGLSSYREMTGVTSKKCLRWKQVRVIKDK